MVDHDASMSLIHHVPIFNCTVTRRVWGGSLWGCRFLVRRFEVFGPRSVPSPFCVTSPVLGHMTWLYIDCGHFESHIRCPRAHTHTHYRCSTRGGATMEEPRPFPGSHTVVPPPFPTSGPSTQGHMLLSQAPPDPELISPLLMNAKITHVTWRRELCIALSINSSRSEKVFVCLHCYLKTCIVCFLASETSQTTG